jgi:acyl-CoA dehydrogenase
MAQHAKPDQPIAYPEETRNSNFFESDLNVQRLLERIAPKLLEENRTRLSDFGDWVGGPLDEEAAYSDRYAPPKLETHNKDGKKESRVVFNPSYEKLHREAYERGMIGVAYQKKDPQPHLLSFAMGYLAAQTDISIFCPVTMTGAVAYVLQNFAPEAVREEYLHELTRMDGKAKSGGTWCTELHGGSDIGATTTRAVKDGDKIRLYGLKWFTSNANSGLALATARPEGAPEGSKGLGLYLVPSHLKDGSPNKYSIRRLKDKLGTKALATGEIDLEGAEVIEVAPPPLGLKIMMHALEYSRIDNAVGAAGVQRRAFLEAACWASHRKAFGKTIIEYPMVQNELMDLMMRSEASAAIAFEAAKTFDEALKDESKNTWLRIATALAKYRTAEDAVQCAKKTVELVGGNGYTEEFPSARQYRDSLVLAVWEGPANIQALELMRMVAGKEPGDRIFIDKVRQISEALPATMNREKLLLDKGLKEAENALAYLRQNNAEIEKFARKLMDHMADVLSGALLAEEAAHDLTLGDARKAIVANKCLEKFFGRNEFEIGAGVDPVLANFKEIVGYGAVSPEKAGYAAPSKTTQLQDKRLPGKRAP